MDNKLFLLTYQGAGDAVASKYPADTLTPKKALDGQWPKQKVAEFERYETCSNLF